MTTTTNTRSTTATAKAATSKVATEKTAAKTSPAKSTGAATNTSRAGLHDDKGLRLAALRDLKDVAVREIPDVRGWHVELRDGVSIGKVVRILVDQQAQHLPRYLDIRIEPTQFGMAGEPWNTLVPLGQTQLAKGRDVVLLPSIGKDQLTVLRPLGNTIIDFTFEMGVARAFGLATPMVNSDDLYRTPLFDLGAVMRLRRAVS